MQSIKGAKINLGSILMSVIVGIAVTIILLLIAAALVQGEYLDETKIGIALVAINIIAGLTCGIAAQTIGRGGGHINGMLGGAVYAGTLILAGFLLDIQAQHSAEIAKIITVSLACGFIGSKLNLAKSNKKLLKKRKI